MTTSSLRDLCRAARRVATALADAAAFLSSGPGPGPAVATLLRLDARAVLQLAALARRQAAQVERLRAERRGLGTGEG